MNRYIGPVLLSMAAAVVVYGVALTWGGSEEVFASVRSMDLLHWMIVLGLSLANYLIRFFRWEQYIRQTSGGLQPRLEHALIYIGGFALTTTPGKAGEALRSFYLVRLCVSYKESLAALFTERLVDVLAISLLSLLVVTFYQTKEVWALVSLGGVVLVMIVPALRSDTTWRLVGNVTARFSGKLANVARHVVETFRMAGTLVNGKALPLGLVAGLIAWGAEGYGLYVVLAYFGYDIGIPLAIGIYALSVLAGAATFLPGGLGGTEAVMILLLVAVGVDNPSAVVATLICRIATLWFAVALGSLALSILALQGKLPTFSDTETR